MVRWHGRPDRDIGLNEIVNGKRHGWRDVRVGWDWDDVPRHWLVRLVGIDVGMKREEVGRNCNLFLVPIGIILMVVERVWMGVGIVLMEEEHRQ